MTAPLFDLDIARAMALVPFAVEAVVAGELSGEEAYRLVEDEVEVRVKGESDAASH